MSKKDLYRKLRSIRNVERGIQPDAAWTLRTRETLLMQVRNSMSQAPVSIGKRTRLAVKQLIPQKLIVAFRGPVAAFLSIFGILTGGSIASVSAAENAIPGDILYSVKLATEQTRLILTSDRQDRLKLKTEFVERRAQEIRNIVNSDVDQKGDRIMEAAKILKRDLDTVKMQLNDVSNDGTALEAAEAAKLVDQKSSELADVLKEVKTELPEETKQSVTDAQVAAVNTGVKAVQVLIENASNPEQQQVISNDDLLKAITNKVDGMTEHVEEAELKLGVTATGTVTSTTSTSASSTNANSLNDARQSLIETKQLMEANDLDGASGKLGDAAKALVNVESAVATAATAPTSTPSIAPTVTSTIAVPQTSTTTVPTAPASTSSAPGT